MAGHVQGSFPQAVAFMPNLQGISLANNSFSGPLPSSSNMFNSLLALNISRNSFNGSLPSQLGDMAGFQVGHLPNFLCIPKSPGMHQQLMSLCSPGFSGRFRSLTKMLPQHSALSTIMRTLTGPFMGYAQTNQQVDMPLL